MDPHAPHSLEAEQLELLFDLRNVKVLRVLRRADTASAVAQALELPVNLVHYRINKLLGVGLLRIRQETSRGRVFETVHETFTVPPALVGNLKNALPEMLTDLMNRVYREFFNEFEKLSLALSTLDAERDAVTVDLERNIGVKGRRRADTARFHYVPRTSVTTVRLSEASYDATRSVRDWERRSAKPRAKMAATSAPSLYSATEAALCAEASRSSCKKPPATSRGLLNTLSYLGRTSVIPVGSGFVSVWSYDETYR